jgi:MFS family permease
MDPNAKPPIEIRQAFGYPLRDPAWPGKLGLGAFFLLLCVLVVGIPIVLGYLRRLFLQAVQDPDAPLPEWDAGGDLRDGGPAALVVAVYGLAGFLLFSLPLVGPFLALIPAFLLPAALTGHFALGSLAAGFDIPTMLEYVRDNLENYLLGVVLGLVVAALSLLGLVALIVGVFFTSAWGVAVTAHAWAQVYRNSKLVTAPVTVLPDARSRGHRPRPRRRTRGRALFSRRRHSSGGARLRAGAARPRRAEASVAALQAAGTPSWSVPPQADLQTAFRLSACAATATLFPRDGARGVRRRQKVGP